ncbi:MAG: hypothetical protein ACRDHP_08160, partial [Ktedonobacterales bacterium]
ELSMRGLVHYPCGIRSVLKPARISRIVTESSRQRAALFRVLTRERLNNVGKSVGSSACQPSPAAC